MKSSGDGLLYKCLSLDISTSWTSSENEKMVLNKTSVRSFSAVLSDSEPSAFVYFL